MTKAAARAPARAADLIDVKLQPPRLRADLVVRARLLERLTTPGDEDIVAVIAPAGYGKTTLLAQWRAAESRPVGWVTIDDSDADPSALFPLVATAIDRAIGLAPDVADMFRQDGATSLLSAIARLSSAMNQQDRSLVLMLDDLHHIAGSTSIDALAVLIGYLPRSVGVVVAGRSDAGLPLARFRAMGRVIDVTESDLAMDEEESLAAIRRVNRTIATEDARRIHHATEGWAAAVYLAARTGPGLGDPPADEPRGTGASVARYLDAELLSGRDASTMAFLTHTAILDRLTGGLCDAVVGTRGSGALLHRLSVEDHLVAPLDDAGRWYRYHAILRDHLLGLLDRDTVDIADLHDRAAVWLESNGQPSAAIDHLFAAGHDDAAARLISAVALMTWRSGRVATLNGWVARLDDATLRRHPYVAAVAAWSHLIHGQWQEAQRMGDLIAHAEYEGPRPAGTEAYEVARLLIQAMSGTRDLAAAIDDARAAVDLEPASGGWAPVAGAVLGLAELANGDLAAAEAALRDIPAIAATSRGIRAQIAALSGLALIASERDDWLQAAELDREAGRLVAAFEQEPDATIALQRAVAARLAVRRGDLLGAHRHLAAFQAASTTLSVAAAWMSVLTLLEAGRAYLAVSDPSGARTVLRQADDILARRSGLGPLADRVATFHQRIRALPPGPGGASTLTAAEIRVLRLLPTYLSVPEIADRLIVSSNTVRTQVQSIYGKLGASSRAEAVERAIEAGLLEPLPVLSGGDITTQ